MFYAPVHKRSCNRTQRLPTPWWLAHAKAVYKALPKMPCKALSMVLASACENKSRHVVAKTLIKLLDNIFASVTLAGDVVEFAPPPFFFVISFFLLSCSVFGFCHPLLLHLFSRLRFLVLCYISHSTLIALPPTEVGTVSCESLCVSFLCFDFISIYCSTVILA